MNPNIFREYDVRGVADRDLTDADVLRFGRAFGTYIQAHGVDRCVVGRDVRLSSPRIQRALIEGLLATGVDVVDIGVVPTPVLYFSFFHLNCDAGVMVTASHNPPLENGFKLGLHKTTIYGSRIQALRILCEREQFRYGRGTLTEIDIIPAYVELCRSKVRLSRRLKVVFDPGNGTAGLLLERLFVGTPVEPVYVNLQPDGTFPVHIPDPTVAKYMERVVELVRSSHADCGIGYDGDADRIGAVDENGEMVYGDRLLGIYAGEVVKATPGVTVVFDVKCSQGLVEHLNSIGARPLMWKTGHSLIKAKMKEENAPLAGEMSGHMMFADDYYGYDDAIYASLRLLRIIAATEKKLSVLAAAIPAYHSTPEIRISCPDELKNRVVNDLTEVFRDKYDVIDIDGARVVFSDGWGLIRASNTQPVLVLRFEARTPEGLAAIQDTFYSRLRAYPEVALPE